MRVIKSQPIIEHSFLTNKLKGSSFIGLFSENGEMLSIDLTPFLPNFNQITKVKATEAPEQITNENGVVYYRETYFLHFSSGINIKFENYITANPIFNIHRLKLSTTSYDYFIISAFHDIEIA
jgi:hypothetical protein